MRAVSGAPLTVTTNNHIKKSMKLPNPEALADSKTLRFEN